MKIRFGIVGCGFLGNIGLGRMVFWKWSTACRRDQPLTESRDKTAAETGCRSCRDLAELLSLEPEYIVEAASVEAVRDMACTVLEHGVSLVLPLGPVLLPTLPFTGRSGTQPAEDAPKSIWQTARSVVLTSYRRSL